MRLAKLNEHTIDVILSEDVKEKNTVTSHPVEEGADITDHAKNDPLTVSISGAFTAPGAWERLKPLRDMKRRREFVRYVGRNIFSNLIITDLSTSHPQGNFDGAEFSMTLQQVHMAKGKKFNENVKGKKTKTQVAKKTSQGRKQVRSK